MEKLIIPKTTSDMESLLTKLFERAMGVGIKFSNAPAVTDLNPDSWGWYGNDLYFRMSDGSGIKVTGSAF